MSSYIPPHLRDKKTPRVTPDAFPTLGCTNTMTKNNWSGKSFATLATEWKTKDETDKDREEFERLKRIREESSIGVGMANLYRYRAENDDRNQPEDTTVYVAYKPDSDWNEIKRKPRKIKTREEMEADELRRQAEEEANNRANMWSDDGIETHQTYWDQKY